MKQAMLLLLSFTAGCSQLLGLEDTKFDQRDAMTDAPSACDGAPRCMSTTGRSVCGQLYGTGAAAGQLVRVASPTGETCANLSSSEGPCAFTVFGQTTTTYYANEAVSRIAGEIDDCGRFVVPDLDAAAADVVVAVRSTDFVESATVVLGRGTVAGESDRGAQIMTVSTATAMAWSTQVSATSPPDLTQGSALLVTYINPMGERLATQEIRVNGGGVNDAPNQPWGAYFSGEEPFGTIDPVLPSTLANGSALVVPATGPLQLGGFRPGKNCTPVMVQAKANALIHVTLSC